MIDAAFTETGEVVVDATRLEEGAFGPGASTTVTAGTAASLSTGEKFFDTQTSTTAQQQVDGDGRWTGEMFVDPEAGIIVIPTTSIDTNIETNLVDYDGYYDDLYHFDGGDWSGGWEPMTSSSTNATEPWCELPPGLVDILRNRKGSGDVVQNQVATQMVSVLEIYTDAWDDGVGPRGASIARKEAGGAAEIASRVLGRLTDRLKGVHRAADTGAADQEANVTDDEAAGSPLSRLLDRLRRRRGIALGADAAAEALSNEADSSAAVSQLNDSA